MNSNRPATSLIKNSAINLTGQLLPMLVAIYAIPKVLHELGEDRLGVLTLAWMFIGYFTLFDLGLGRAVTKEMARFSHDPAKSMEVFWTGTLSTLALGLLAGAVFYLVTPFLTENLLNIPESLREEVQISFRSIALALPFVISAVSFRGVLEARGKFLEINLVQVPLGISNYLVPVWVSQTQPDIGLIISYMMFVRVISWILLALLAFRGFSFRAPKYSMTEFKKLLSFGGWITVSNVIGPIITYADRILIGSMLSTAAIAHYATPFEMTSRLWVIPSALIGVIFPALAALPANQNDRVKDLFWGGTKVIFLLMFPVGLFLSTFSSEILTIWLGQSFALSSEKVLWWLGISIVINSVGFMPASFLQSRGRPDIPAKLLLMELPFYLVLMLVLLNTFGVQGAAMAWFIRVAVDSTILFGFSHRELKVSMYPSKNLVLLFVLSLVFLALMVLTPNVYFRLGEFVLICCVFLRASWLWMLSATEKQKIKAIFLRK